MNNTIETLTNNGFIHVTPVEGMFYTANKGSETYLIADFDGVLLIYEFKSMLQVPKIEVACVGCGGVHEGACNE